MESFDELRARHARELDALNRRHAIANACPIPPGMVTSETARAPWVSYTVPTLADACNIMRAFTVIPSELWRSGCTMVAPESTMSERDKSRYGEPTSGPWACWIDVSSGEGFGPSARLVFYAELPTGPVRVNVDFGRGYIGTCPPLAPVWQISRGASGKIYAKSARPNPELHSASDDYVNWSSGDLGPIKESARHSYLFCADQYETMPGAKESHALAQLAILASRAGV